MYLSYETSIVQDCQMTNVGTHRWKTEGQKNINLVRVSHVPVCDHVHAYRDDSPFRFHVSPRLVCPTVTEQNGLR